MLFVEILSAGRLIANRHWLLSTWHEDWLQVISGRSALGLDVVNLGDGGKVVNSRLAALIWGFL